MNKEATRWHRFCAFTVDMVILGIVSAFAMYLIFVVGGIAVDGRQFANSLNGFRIILALFYFPAFTLATGATPGKMYFGMKVVSQYDTSLTPVHVLLREGILRWVGLAVLGHIWILIHRRAAWDYIGMTKVIYANNPSPVPRFLGKVAL